MPADGGSLGGDGGIGGGQRGLKVGGGGCLGCQLSAESGDFDLVGGSSGGVGVVGLDWKT